jgi:hypothetical protein
MKQYLLFLIIFFISIYGCTSNDTTEEMQIPDLIDELTGIADSGLECLEAHSVTDPNVSYDVLETDSLVNPIIGKIEVEISTAGVTSSDGTPILMLKNMYEHTFVIEGGKWKHLELKVIHGRPYSDTDPVSICFK